MPTQKRFIKFFSFVFVSLLVSLSLLSLPALAGTNGNGADDGLPCPGGGPDYRGQMQGSFAVRLDRIGTDTRYSPGFDAAWYAQCMDPSSGGALQNLFNLLVSDIAGGVITKCNAGDTVSFDSAGNIMLCSDEADSYISISNGNWIWNYYSNGGGGGGGGPLPAPVCGDAYCATEESCNSCAADCGACPIPGTPGISGVNPRVAAPGQTVYIYGEGLTANVLLTSSGQDIGATGVLSADLKTLSFVLPNNAPQGIYNISVGSLTTGLTLKIVDGGGIFNPLGLPPIPPAPTTFAGLVQYVYTYSLYLLGIAVFVMIFYAGFLWMTAAGNGGQIGRAKSIIYNAIIGAILLASAYIILNTINPDLVGGSYTFPGIQGR